MLFSIQLNSTKQTENGHHKGICRHPQWPQLGYMGSSDPGGRQGLKLLGSDKRRKNPGHYTAHIWPTRKTSARHRHWTNLRCGPVCQITLRMEQDELDGPGPHPGKVEPGTVARLCWCQRCHNVLDLSWNQVRKSMRSKYLPAICWND